MRRSARAGTGEKRPREAGDEPTPPPEAKKRQTPPSAERRRHTKPPAKPAAKKPVPRPGSQTAKPASRPASESTPRTVSQPAAKPTAAKPARPGVEALQETAAAKREAMLEKEHMKADARKAKESAKAVKEAAAEEKRRRAADLKADRERKRADKGILRELSGFLEVAHQRLMTDASLESEWRTLLGQTAGLTPGEPDPGAELKRRLLERFFHSRAKRSCAHAMDTARKFKKADTAVRAQAKTRKSSSGSAGGGVVVKFNKSALQRTMTPSQLHKTLVALVSLAGHLLVLEKSTKVDEAKALIKAYGGLVGGAAAPKTKSGWLDALVACIHAQQSKGFSQPDNDIMLAD